MENIDISRRTLGVGIAGVAALASMQQATAATMASGGTWFDMVKAHHTLIAETFDKLLAADKPGPRAASLKHLGYLLTAHSVAEENVLYPAIAMQGMASDSDKLYLDQAHAKVGNAGLDMLAKDDPAFNDKVKALQTAVLHHAKDDEEGNLFPKLMQAMGNDGNAKLTKLYHEQFASIRAA